VFKGVWKIVEAEVRKAKIVKVKGGNKQKEKK